MGLYYNPPMPNMGGQQPPAQAPIVPISGETPANPPFMGGAKVPQQVLDAWTPPPPSVMFDDGPITFPIGAPLPNRNWWYRIQETIVDWIPPPLAPQLNPFTPMGVVVAPRPPIREYWAAQVEITTQWIPGPPGPYLQGQPYTGEVAVPPISGPAPQNPPFAGGSAVSLAILSAWIPPPPQPPVAILLDPPISSDFPIVGTRVPDGVVQAWAIPPAQPIEPAVTPHGVDSPLSPTLVPAAVLAAWSVPVPMPMSSVLGRLPSSSDRPIPPARPEDKAWYPPAPAQVIMLASPISTPPPGPPPIVGSPIPQAEFSAWISPDPASQSARDIVPFIGPEPPHPNRIPQAVVNAWLPPPPQPIVAVVMASPLSSDFPIRSAVADFQSWFVPAPRPLANPLTTPPSVGGGPIKIAVPDAVMQLWDALPPTAIILEIPIPPSADQPVVGSPVPIAVLDAWLPPDPMPTVIKNFPQPGPTPSTPPFLRSNIEIANSWMPPQAEPYLAAQPYAIEVTVPPIGGPAPQNPPFVGGAAVPKAVLINWLVTPPDQVIRLRPAASTAPALPPPVLGSQVPPAVLVSWRLPEPMPTIVIVAPQGAPAPSQPPPLQGGANIVFDAWTPPPPRPIMATVLAKPVSADQPPIGTKVPDGVIQAWTIPPPAPIVAELPTPPSADRPPPLRPLQYPEPVFTPIALAKQTLSAPLPQPVLTVSIWNAWLPADPVPVPKALNLTYVAPVISAPVPNSNQFWSIYASWISVQPQPIYGGSVITLLQPSFVLNPNLIATVAPRRMIATIISRTMSRTNDLGPPIDAAVEQETVTFDFGPVLKTGVVITSIVSLTCAVYSGRDPTPSSRLIGASAFGPSPRTFANTAAVYQLVGNMLGGVTYRLQCVVTTSDGQTLSGYTHLACQTPN